MTHDHEPHGEGAQRAERIERRWATLSVGIVALLIVMAAFAGIHQATMPQPVLETADPRTLHIAGEFTEANLGSSLEPDGSVMVRAIGQQYSFTPACIVVPVGTPIAFRATSADVVHGFLIDGTNVNVMLVPGYVSTIATRFETTGERHMPCHEFCGTGHEGMWGRIRVVDKATFQEMATRHRRLSCVDQ
ncbi:cytochrome c oxidase subunit II [Azospirillum sp. B4]|uniref:cytochrome c oxidase subunit II n=1 Tax=Azospirillum sp. B4 TaxID=95605 RepID=UPI0003483247|nr:cytochrome c oxidase subunit II [Azospirillum sp. B4]